MSNTQTAVPETIQRNRNKYITALRSGKYDQAIGILHDEVENTFCAVGCALHALDDNYKRMSFTEMCKATSELFYISTGYVQDIVTLNDDDELSFNEIADLLEERGFLSNKDYRGDGPSPLTAIL